MEESRPELRRGRIIWARVRDRRGVAKERPVIILTATAEIRPDDPLAVMAITSTFPDPPPADHVPLPWHPAGRALTKLRKRSAAVLSWISEVEHEDVIQLYGDVPARLMITILEQV